MKQPQVAKQLRKTVKSVIPKKKSNTKIILIAVTNLAALVGVAVAVLFVSNKALEPLERLTLSEDEPLDL